MRIIIFRERVIYMLASVFLSLIYLFFPLCCYFMYVVYTKVKDEREKMIFFDLALFSSYYLCSRFSNLPIAACFLINIPLLLSIYKKRVFPSVVLLFTTSRFLWDVYNSNIYLFLIQYLIIFTLGYFTKININNVFLICKVTFGIIISIFFPNDVLNVKLLGYAFLVWIIMYLVFYAIIKFYDKVSKVVELYSSLEEITKEKKLYESLFKITHEIKNPLAVCKGYLDMFDVNNPAKASRYAGIIDQEIDRTLLLLKDFSNVSKLNIDKEKMEVGMLLDDVCDEAELILDNNIKFISDIKDDDVYIEADYNRIKQVLINVIKNSKEAITSKGKIVLKTYKKKGNYVMEISDNGIGMDKSTKDKIGTAFYTTKSNGTGLGVCFSKEIIEKHKGTMKYTSKMGEGTTVKITLPIKK